jgi:hypothetical protein
MIPKTTEMIVIGMPTTIATIIEYAPTAAANSARRVHLGSRSLTDGVGGLSGG